MKHFFYMDTNRESRESRESKRRIFYSDFDNLLNEYKNPQTREEQLIKHKLDSIVALYDKPQSLPLPQM